MKMGLGIVVLLSVSALALAGFVLPKHAYAARRIVALPRNLSTGGAA